MVELGDISAVPGRARGDGEHAGVFDEREQGRERDLWRLDVGRGDERCEAGEPCRNWGWERDGAGSVVWVDGVLCGGEGGRELVREQHVGVRHGGMWAGRAGCRREPQGDGVSSEQGGERIIGVECRVWHFECGEAGESGDVWVGELDGAGWRDGAGGFEWRYADRADSL